MKSTIFLSLSLLYCLTLQAKEAVDISSMKELKEHMGQQKPLVIMFYAPWCEACKEMKNALNHASTQLETEATVVKIDLDKKSMAEAADLFNIEAIPTIIIKHTGRILAEDLVSAVRSLTKQRSAQQKKENAPSKKESQGKKIEPKTTSQPSQSKKASMDKPVQKRIAPPKK